MTNDELILEIEAELLNAHNHMHTYRRLLTAQPQHARNHLERAGESANSAQRAMMTLFNRTKPLGRITDANS